MNSERQVRLPTGLLMASAVLIGTGAVIGAAGIILGGGATVVTIRRWVQALDEPPRAIARRRWHQMSDSVAAGAQAWRASEPGH